MKEKILNSKGQTLVMLLVFISVSIIVVSGAITVAIINTTSAQKFSQASVALSLAETGVDNAVLRLLRDPGYSGETMTLGNGTATITVTGGSTKTILSEGDIGSIKRKIQVIGNYSNNIFTQTSWSEVN